MSRMQTDPVDRISRFNRDYADDWEYLDPELKNERARFCSNDERPPMPEYGSGNLEDALKAFEIQLRKKFLECRFTTLAETWKKETCFLSNVNKKMMHHAYQSIIGMGRDVVPFILNDLLENGPNHWFWALTAITNENPITEDVAGNMTAMTEAWLQWGKKTNYLKKCQKMTSGVSEA